MIGGQDERFLGVSSHENVRDMGIAFDDGPRLRSSQCDRANGRADGEAGSQRREHR